jgi:hypothetical protein
MCSPPQQGYGHLAPEAMATGYISAPLMLLLEQPLIMEAIHSALLETRTSMAEDGINEGHNHFPDDPERLQLFLKIFQLYECSLKGGALYMQQQPLQVIVNNAGQKGDAHTFLEALLAAAPQPIKQMTVSGRTEVAQCMGCCGETSTLNGDINGLSSIMRLVVEHGEHEVTLQEIINTHQKRKFQGPCVDPDDEECKSDKHQAFQCYTEL